MRLKLPFINIALLTFLIFTETHLTEAAELNLTATNVKQIKHYNSYVKNLMKDAAERMEDICDSKRDIFVNTAKHDFVNLPIKRANLEKAYHKLVRELALNLSVVPAREITDPLLRRSAKRLAKLQLFGLNGTEYYKAKELLHGLQTVITSRNIEAIRNKHKYLTITSVLYDIISTKRLEDLEYYWYKWREATGLLNTAKKGFIDYIKMLRKAAAYNGHITPSRTWYLYYETDNFQRELEDVVWEIMPLYRELHAYLRNSARLVYSNRLTKSNGAIPAQIMEQYIHQAWYTHTGFYSPYPKSELPVVQTRLAEVFDTNDKLNKKAAHSFELLGLNLIPESFYNNYSRRIPDDEAGPQCKSEVYYFPPDVALRYCPKIDYKKLMQMHGNMAEVQYNIFKSKIPFGLDTEPCPGFGAALAEAAIVASGTPRHLYALHILYDEDLNKEQAINRLLRMAVHTVPSVMQYFIHDKYLADVLDRRIANNELNCGYWRLQYKYAGIVPPVKRDERNFDPDYKFYRFLHPEKSSTMKFISEVLGYQFLRAFCLLSNTYKPGNPQYPLSNCDFYNDVKAGEAIKKMMELGATKHWRDIMEIGIGERTLSGRGVMEYFAPLFTWLQEYNRAHDLEPGWSSNIKCGRK